MRWLQVLAVLGVLGLAANWLKDHREARAMQVLMSPNGFLPVPMPEGAAANTVLIFAPINCPKEGAQRARALSEALTAQGIANVKTDHYGSRSFTPSEEEFAKARRLDFVMTGELPIALINGMGKANPSLEEVEAEYRRTQ